MVNRYATLIYYLSDDFEGGETCFPLANVSHEDGSSCPEGTMCRPPALPAKAFHRMRKRLWTDGGDVIANCDRGLRIAPAKGTAVLFYNMPGLGHGPGPDGAGLTDETAFHNGCPVLERQVNAKPVHPGPVSTPKLIANNWFFNQKPAGR
eukprot:SAG31_NODE_13200_length_886_cov_1.255400_2_plen_150_part_00